MDDVQPLPPLPPVYPCPFPACRNLARTDGDFCDPCAAEIAECLADLEAPAQV